MAAFRIFCFSGFFSVYAELIILQTPWKGLLKLSKLTWLKHQGTIAAPQRVTCGEEWACVKAALAGNWFTILFQMVPTTAEITYKQLPSLEHRTMSKGPEARYCAGRRREQTGTDPVSPWADFIQPICRKSQWWSSCSLPDPSPTLLLARGVFLMPIHHLPCYNPSAFLLAPAAVDVWGTSCSFYVIVFYAGGWCQYSVPQSLPSIKWSQVYHP